MVNITINVERIDLEKYPIIPRRDVGEVFIKTKSGKSIHISEIPIGTRLFFYGPLGWFPYLYNSPGNDPDIGEKWEIQGIEYLIRTDPDGKIGTSYILNLSPVSNREKRPVKSNLTFILGNVRIVESIFLSK